MEQRAINTVVHALAGKAGLLLSCFYLWEFFFSLPQKDFNLKDYCSVLLTHWSILAQNCGLIRISFPVVIIKLGCWTCSDCKQIIKQHYSETWKNDTTLSSILSRLCAWVTLGFSRQLITNWNRAGTPKGEAVRTSIHSLLSKDIFARKTRMKIWHQSGSTLGHNCVK